MLFAFCTLIHLERCDDFRFPHSVPARLFAKCMHIEKRSANAISFYRAVDADVLNQFILFKNSFATVCIGPMNALRCAERAAACVREWVGKRCTLALSAHLHTPTAAIR